MAKNTLQSSDLSSKTISSFFPLSEVNSEEVENTLQPSRGEMQADIIRLVNHNEKIRKTINKTQNVTLEIQRTVIRQQREIERNENLVFFGFIILLVMVAGMLIDVFFMRNSPQHNYNYTLENGPARETIKDVEIQKLKKQIQKMEESNNGNLVPLVKKFKLEEPQ